MEFKGTKVKWGVGGANKTEVKSFNGTAIAECGMSQMVSMEEREANARLIASPDLFKIFWGNVKSTYPAGTSKHSNAILEEDFEKVWGEILELISVRKTESKLKEVFDANESGIHSKSLV